MSSSTSEGDLPQVCKNGGAKRSRTADLLIANETLYQLSYSPIPTLIMRKGPICSRNRKNRKFIYFMLPYIFGFALTLDKHKLN